MDAFPDLTVFIVLSEEPRTVEANFANTPNASTRIRLSRNLSRRELACVKIIRVDLNNNDLRNIFAL